MSVYDLHIDRIREFVEKTGKERVMPALQDLNELGKSLTLKLEGKKGSNIVLKSEVFLELGSPEVGSSSFTLYSDNPDLIKHEQITLIGEDVNESSSKVLPFGQVILVGGKDLTEEDYYLLNQNLNISDLIEGYMIRSTTENIWCRISKDAAKKGFNFKGLGSVLIWHIKEILPKVESVEVLFITSSKEDIRELNQIGIDVREIARGIKERIWRERGVDILKCAPSGHCGSCKDKTVCDNIRKMGAS
mgnify:FL=1